MAEEHKITDFFEKPLRVKFPQVLSLNKFRAEEIELQIAPPLKAAITIPVLVGGVDTGFVIYVAASAFVDATTENAAILREIAKRLEIF